MKKLILTLSALAMFTVTSLAQANNDQSDSQVFTIVQQMPSYPGDIYKFLADNIKYPEAERKKGIQGTVYINFVVEKDGTLTNIKILRGVDKGPGLDAEALRVMHLVPRFNPGMQNGHAVRVAYNIPIKFVLN